MLNDHNDHPQKPRTSTSISNGVSSSPLPLPPSPYFSVPSRCSPKQYTHSGPSRAISALALVPCVSIPPLLSVSLSPMPPKTSSIPRSAPAPSSSATSLVALWSGAAWMTSKASVPRMCSLVSLSAFLTTLQQRRSRSRPRRGSQLAAEMRRTASSCPRMVAGRCSAPTRRSACSGASQRLASCGTRRTGPCTRLVHQWSFKIYPPM
jgi:hypothetical protein